MLTITLPPAPPIRDLALSVGVSPPLLTFLAPAAGAVLNTRTPDLLLRYTDTGQDVDPQSLQIQANATPLPATCTHNAMQAQCVPTTALPFGPVTLTATIADVLGNESVPATLHIRINQAPVAQAGVDQTVHVGATVALNSTGSSDPDTDPLEFQWQFTLQPAASQAVLQQATTATPSFVADVAGTYQTRLTVSDSYGASTTALVTVTAIVPNQAPRITSTPVTAGTVGQLYTYAVEATDPDARDVLTFSLPVAPAGMDIDPSTGLIQWTPAAAQAGNQDVTVRVQDQGGLFAEQSFTVTIIALPTNQAPVALDDAYTISQNATTPPEPTVLFGVNAETHPAVLYTLHKTTGAVTAVGAIRTPLAR